MAVTTFFHVRIAQEQEHDDNYYGAADLYDSRNWMAEHITPDHIYERKAQQQEEDNTPQQSCAFMNVSGFVEERDYGNQSIFHLQLSTG